MPRLRALVPCAVLAMLLATPGALAAGGEALGLGEPRPTPAPRFAPDRVIVEWAQGADRVDRASARNVAEVSSLRQLGEPAFQLVKLDPGQSMAEALASLRSDPYVLAASRDGYSVPNSIPNDPLFGQLWGLRNLGNGIAGFSGAVFGDDINAPLAWDREVGSSSVVIADLDSGYRFDSPDLGPVAWENSADPVGGGDNDGNGFVDDTHGYDFVGASADSPSSDNDPTDNNLISGGHGVHTAGTMGAAGNNGVGITGVAQNARIMPLRVCANSAIAGNEARCPFSSQISAINYAGNMGAKVANMSLGGTTSNATVRDAIASHPGTLYVISAGNDSEDNDVEEPHYPCNYNPLAEGKSAVDNVVCVAATNQSDQLAGFSDWGATSVDLGAPGTETLSTYPVISALFSEGFEANDFATKWEPTGAGFGRADPGDGPLVSFGMNDSPGGPPANSSSHVTTLISGAAVPSGSGACTLSGMRFRHADPGSSFFYQVLSDDVPVFTNTGSANTGGSAMAPFSTEPITGLGGHSVKVRFGYTAGALPGEGDGIWLDDLRLTCYAPLSTLPTYEFLQGTSMAAPHVTGAAGLLFSLDPSATVTEVRNALLAGVDPVPSLAGKTETGGRLDLVQAMNALEGETLDKTPPAAPVLTSTSPISPANNGNPRIVGSAEAGSSVQLYLGTECKGVPVATGTAAELASPGIAVGVPSGSTLQFSATAADGVNNRSACSNSISYTNSPGGGVVAAPPAVVVPVPAPPPAIKPTCKVPKLAGKTRNQATAALRAAHCTLGRVTKPRARKGQPAPVLVVKSSSPGVGSQPASGKVDLTLSPKPKPKKRHH